MKLIIINSLQDPERQFVKSSVIYVWVNGGMASGLSGAGAAILLRSTFLCLNVIYQGFYACGSL